MNDYKFAEISNDARIKALKQLDKTVEKYHYMQVHHCPVDWIEIFADYNELRRIMDVGGTKDEVSKQ